MTQKRGLGRGLGALIPGAGAPAAAVQVPTSAESAKAGSPADKKSAAAAASVSSAEKKNADSKGPATGTQTSEETADVSPTPLRTRRSVAAEKDARDLDGTSSARSEGAARSSARPVDMFFSGEPVDDGASRTGSSARSSRELADEMAEAAKKRRRGGKNGAAKKRGAPGATAGEEMTTTMAKVAATVHAREVEDSPAVDVEPGHRYPAHEKSAAHKRAEIEREAHQAAEDRARDAQGSSGQGGDAQGANGQGDEGQGGAKPGDDDLVPVPGARFAEVPIDSIRENPRNPRTVFDEDALDELAYSLREVGVLQPVVIRTIDGASGGETYELVMGERRWRAAKRAGLSAIPAIIRETTDDDLLRDALLENLHRAELNPLEEAAAYQQLLDDFNCTQDELAERIGRSRPQISNTLRLLRLPAVVQRQVAAGLISAGHARALLGLESPALMEELSTRIVAEGLSVRQVEKLVATGDRKSVV